MSSFSTAGGGVKAPTSIQATLGYGRWGGGVSNPTATKQAACCSMISMPTGSIGTVLNVTGSGFIQFLMMTHPYAGYTVGPSTLTIDGILVSTLAGFGGDVKFLKTKLSAAYYKPLLFRSVILGVSGKLGYVTGLGDKVTQSQRFNLGGRNIRGFGSGGIGPRDTGSSDAVGGNKMYAGSFEVVSNLGLDKDTGVRWSVFTDFGSLWSTDYPSGVTKPNETNMRVSAGVSIFWSTAIGPLSFSWAKPLSKMAHDTAKTFQFNIGTRL